VLHALQIIGDGPTSHRSPACIRIVTCTSHRVERRPETLP
jgi:hypothetical protein